jgi:hypothetical protein
MSSFNPVVRKDVHHETGYCDGRGGGFGAHASAGGGQRVTKGVRAPEAASKLLALLNRYSAKERTN